MIASVETYISSSFDSLQYKFFGIDPLEEYQEKVAKLTDNLNHLKSFTVEEYTFYKMWENVSQLKPQYHFSNRLSCSIWKPNDLNDEQEVISYINNLKPTVQICETIEEKRKWIGYRHFLSSAVYAEGPGRQLHGYIINTTDGKILGLIHIASDVIAMGARDKHIGWTPENRFKDKMLNNIAIGTTIIATQPLGYNLLGGKLVACMATTKVVRDAWKKKYGDVLVGMTTTSLYGGFSQYNGLKWWKDVGTTLGQVPLTLSKRVYSEWLDYMKMVDRKEYDRRCKMSSPKSKLMGWILDAAGLDISEYHHGFNRGIYFSSFYENTKEFLCKKITEEQLKMKPLFEGDVDAIVEWWKVKATDRYKKLKAENRLKDEVLWYRPLIEMDYETAKTTYFSEVGR